MPQSGKEVEQRRLEVPQDKAHPQEVPLLVDKAQGCSDTDCLGTLAEWEG